VFTITAVEAVAAAPRAAVISVVFTDVTAARRAAVIQVVFTAVTVVLAIGVVVGTVANNPIPSSRGLGIFGEAYSDSKCTFRFFVEHFYYVCNRNIIPVTTSKILAQKSRWYNFKCK